MPQLDGLRTVAVGLVLLQHLGGMFFLAPGHRGVGLFFVLSGFLITGILLRSRDKIDRQIAHSGVELWNFYVRRTARIFPLYYGVVFIFALLFNVEHGRDYWAWLLGYLENIKISLENSEPPIWSIFWSLAVEEHFYIFWPTLILLASRKVRLSATLLLLIVGPLWRTLCLIYAPSHEVALYKIDFACVDSLALGALLAQVHYYERLRTWGLLILNWILLPAAIFFSAGLALLKSLEVNWTFELVLSDIAIGLIFCALISKASVGFGGLPGWVLNSRTVIFIGKVSYGIYVYHLLCLWALKQLCIRQGLPGPLPGLSTFLLVTPATILISWLSWRWFEVPLMNRIKLRFHKKAQQPVSPLPAETLAV